MFQVSIVITISGDEFVPSPALMNSRHLERSWKPGDFALPCGRGRRFDDSGLVFRILQRFNQVDWAEAAIGEFREVSELIWQNTDAILPTPLVSVQVATDGQDYPPLYLDRQFMVEVERIKAELDIDVIPSL